MDLRVIDLDGSLPRQAPLRARLDDGRAVMVDASDLAASLRLVAPRPAMRSFVRRIAESGGRGGKGPEITFYGSGDFHHLTAGLVGRIEEPLTIVHFDNHPDWCRFPKTFNCGAWVNRALELEQVCKIVTIGPCSDDLVRPEWQGANLRAIIEGRLELYPWRHVPSRVWGRYGDGPNLRQRDGHIHWRNLADEDWSDFLAELVVSLPTRAVWLTIDKDVLRGAEAYTNWDQGEMSLDRIEAAVRILAQHCEIVGIDVCGDYSPPRFGDLFRRTLAYFDHPSGLDPDEADLAVNARTNAVLLRLFEEIWS